THTATVDTCTATVAGDHTVTGTDAGAVHPTDDAVLHVNPAAAHHLAFTTEPSASYSADDTITVTVAVQDAFNNTVTSGPDAARTIGLTLGGGSVGATLGGTTSKAAVGGVATFTGLSVRTVGIGYTLTAAETGTPYLTDATSSAFNITPGAADHLAFTTQPSASYSADDTITVVVSVQDAFNNTVTSGPNAARTIGLTLGGGSVGATLGGTASKAAVGGVATFNDLNVHKVGSGYTLTAAETGTPELTNATSSAFNITPAAAHHLAFGVQPTNTTAGQAISPAVTVRILDQFDNLVTTNTDNITVAIGTNPGGGTLSGTKTVAAVGGVGTFSTLSIEKTGTGYTLTATSGSLTGATSSAFNITPAAAHHLAFTTQPSASYSADDTITVVVSVQDAFNNTVTSGPNAARTIGLTLGGGSVGAALGGTASKAAVAGVATFADLNVHKVGSGYTLTAADTGTPDLTDATSSAFNITPGAAARIALQGATGNLVSGATRILTAYVQDGFGNTATSDDTSVVTFAKTAGTGSVTGLGTDTATDGVATKVVTGNLVGSVTIAATSGTLTAGTGNPITFTVVPRGTSVTVSSITSPQYSDPTTITATVTPAALANGDPISGSVTFSVGSTVLGVGTVSVVSGVATATIAPNIMLAPNLSPLPPSYAVTAEFASGDARFGASQGTGSLRVRQEDARTTYTGPLFYATASPTTSSALVPLSTTVQDITAVLPGSDANAGDIRNAVVKFVDRDNGNALLCTASLSLVNPADSKTATASCSATLSTDNTGSTQYTVGTIVSGYYTRDVPDDDTVVTVSLPLGSSFITGGGYLVATSSAGQLPAAQGSRSNFGFNVKYNKSGSNLQGHLNVIYRNGGRTYQIKSNSLTSLVVPLDSANKPIGTATFVAQVNVQDVTNPLAPTSVLGGGTLKVTMYDKGEPGSADTIGMTLTAKSGALFFSTNWVSNQTVEKLLTGGNLVVH
ncbi:MAG: hypothetical protein QOE35_3212, partial [Actinomycetota bacterium]